MNVPMTAITATAAALFSCKWCDTIATRWLTLYSGLLIYRYVNLTMIIWSIVLLTYGYSQINELRVSCRKIYSIYVLTSNLPYLQTVLSRADVFTQVFTGDRKKLRFFSQSQISGDRVLWIIGISLSKTTLTHSKNEVHFCCYWVLISRVFSSNYLAISKYSLRIILRIMTFLLSAKTVSFSVAFRIPS